MRSAQVFITGGTGYMGRRLIPAFIAREHRVDALVRPESESRLRARPTPFVGDVLSRSSFRERAASGW
jgi:thioester reductase-like protein